MFWHNWFRGKIVTLIFFIGSLILFAYFIYILEIPCNFATGIQLVAWLFIISYLLIDVYLVFYLVE